MSDLFSPAGIAAWRARLVRSAAFREAAGTWTGTVMIIEGNAPDPDRATYVALDQGAITATRPAAGDDAETAEFVLKASAATWQQLMQGELELIAAAMSGRIKLERGSVLRLIPHARAASVLLREAAGGAK